MFVVRTAALAALVVALSAFSPSHRVGTLTLVNDSSYTVTHVYVSPCEEDEWLGDLLDADEVLEPGYEVEVTVDDGCWDLLAVVENDVELSTFTVDVSPGEALLWTIFDR